MRKLFLLIGLALSLYPFFGHADPKLSARLKSKYAVLINQDTGATVIEKKHLERIFPASTSKIATALYVMKCVDVEDLDQKIVAPKEVLKKVKPSYKYAHIRQLPPYILQTDGTSYHILPGEELSIRSLLYGLLLSSGNDAANVLAYYVGKGSIENFIEGLNRYLKTIGCQNSHFVNPHGLQHPDQVSTPYDMAIISKEALRIPLLRKIVASKSYYREETNKQKGFEIVQQNKLVIDGKLHFDEALGLKTGYTTAGGYCLLACASNGERELVAALFNSKEKNFRYHDAIEMFNRAFEEKPRYHKVFDRNGPPFKHTLKKIPKPIKSRLQEDVIVTYYPSENPSIHSEVVLNTINLPIHKGEVIGTLIIHVGEHQATSVNLYALEDVKLSWTQTMTFKSLIGCCFIILVATYFLLRRKKGHAAAKV